MKNNLLIQYLWLLLIAIVLLGAGSLLQGCSFTYEEEKAFQKEWEKLDKELENKNDSNK